MKNQVAPWSPRAAPAQRTTLRERKPKQERSGLRAQDKSDAKKIFEKILWDVLTFEKSVRYTQ